MKVIIIRHAESIKNTSDKFASVYDDEPLTRKGIEQAQLLADELYRYIEYNKLKCSSIFAANSLRAITTGTIISNKIETKLHCVDEFLSIKNKNSLSGLTEREVEKLDKTFTNELALSRAGIFNAYNYSSNLNVADIREHENGVYRRYKDIINDFTEDLQIIVMHHSSLTAAMINIARDYYGYPKDFFGNIEANLGSLYLINYDADKVRIDLANVSPLMLNEKNHLEI